MKSFDLAWFHKVLGLLGSDHVGERAAAALKATTILRDAGKSWSDIEVGQAFVEVREAEMMASIYKMTLDSERARTTHMAEEITRLKREVARLKGMWPGERV